MFTQQLFEVLKVMVIAFSTLMMLKFFIFLLLAPFYKIKENLRKIRAFERTGEAIWKRKDLKVSVIVPAWCEEVGVLKTIKSIVTNGYTNYEIIVINDGSTDDTEKVVKDYIVKAKENNAIYKDKVKLFSQANGGKGKALNFGIEKAKGDIILTMDADSAMSEGGLEKLVAYYCDPEIMCVVGNVKVGNNSTIIGLIQKLEYEFGFYFKRSHAVMGGEYIYGGACASFRKEVFEQLGLFDEKNKTEDIEMSMRTRVAGMKCTFAEDVITYTEGASDVMGLISQRVRWKKGRFDTFKQYSKLFFSTNEKHNSALSFFILPYAMLSELQLFFEPIALSLLISYSFISTDWLSLALGSLFVLLVYVVNALFSGDGIKAFRVLLFPVTWPLFYFLAWIEYMALMKSISMTWSGQEVEWQKWKRKNIGSEINL